MKRKLSCILFLSLCLITSLLTLSAWADLNTWTIQTHGLSSQTGVFNAVTYGDSLFVAVGSSIATSPDGTNWTVVPGSSFQYSSPLVSVTYADGMFVAIGSGVAVSSPDGVHWANNTQVPWQFQYGDAASHGIVYGGGVFMVYFMLGDTGDAISLSTNGTAWTQLNFTQPGSYATNFEVPTEGDFLVGMVWNGSEFVGACTAGYIETITATQLLDLTKNPSVFPSWIGFQGPSGSENGWGSLAYANDTYFLGGGPPGGISISSSRSITGSWSADKMPPGSTPISGSDWPVVVGNGTGQLIANTGGAILSTTSTNPPPIWQLSWNMPSYPNSQIHGVVNGDGEWVAVGSLTNGILVAWTSGSLYAVHKITLPTPVWWNIIQLENSLKDQDLMVGDNGSISLVSNGVPYLLKSPTTNQLRGLAEAISGFVAVGADGTIVSSSDGSNWVAEPSPTTNALYGVASGNGVDVAVGTNGTVLVSTNDTNWVSESPTGSNTLISVTYGNGQFEALGTNGTVLLSTNGTNWTTNSLSLPPQAPVLISVTYANGTFTGTDTNGDVLTSTNGISYQILITGTSATAGLNSATLVDGNLLMVGAFPDLLSIQFPVSGTGTSSDLYGVAYSGALYVAVGQSGTIVLSQDADSWSAPTNYFGTGNDLDAVAYGKGLFVGVGQSGWVVTSTDRENWTSESSGATADNLDGVAYGGGKFIAVGDNGTVITSTDGINWTLANSQITASLTAITFANGEFVAVTSYNGSIVSTDGSDWNTNSSGLGSFIQGVGAGNGIFVAVDSSGDTFTSNDGLNWAQQANIDVSLYGVAYENGVFAACGDGGTISVSPNGTNWTQLQTGAENLYGIVAGASEFVAVGEQGTSVSASATALASVPADTAWNVINVPGINDSFEAVAYNGQIYTVLSDDPDANVASSDGLNWTADESGLGGFVNGAAWVNGVFLAVDNSGDISTSSNGTNWTERTDVDVAVYAIDYGGGIYVASSQSGVVYTSPDSLHWTGHNTGLTANLMALTYANGQFVVVAGDGTVATSANGTSWTVQTSATTDALYGIIYGGGLYVAVGQEGTIMTSSDGVGWTLQTNSPITPQDLHAIAWGNNEFIAVGENGWTERSNDGTNWISSSSATLNNLNAIIFANGSFMAVGDNDTIMETPIAAPSRLGPIVVVPGEGVEVTLQGTANTSYSVQVSSDLIHWTPLTGVTLDNTTIGQFLDNANLTPTQPHRFYRAVPIQ